MADAMIDSGTEWGDALRELTRLPGGMGGSLSEVNFLRSGRFRRNARRMFDDCVRPLLEGGASFEVLLGFVDREIARSSPGELGEGFVPEMSDFAAARLRNRETGEIVDVRSPA